MSSTSTVDDTVDKDQIISSLRAEIESLKTIISIMPGHVYWRNMEGYYLGCNNNSASILNYNSPAEIVGKRAIEFMPPEIAIKVDEIDLTVIRTQKQLVLEETGLDLNGQPAIYYSTKTPYYDQEGKILGLVGISLDITTQKTIEARLKIAKEKAEAASRAKSQFLAMISHELRTPLTSIMGFANFIKQNNIPVETQLEYTDHILNSGSYLITLINSLLDYNKLENNKFELFNSPINFKSMVNNVLTMLSSSAKLKNLRLSLDFDPNIPELLMADSKIFQQILINLVGNAIKFTDAGHVTVWVKCLKQFDQSVELYIAVQDTGIGIPKKKQKDIFKRFYQLENVYTRNESLMGTGLGLAIVKQLARLFDSQVKVVSAPKKGSTFFFNVELAIPSAEDLAKHSLEELEYNVIQQEVNPIPDNATSVLLIEDDQLIQIIHKHMLEELGCKVDVIATGRKALEMIGNNYDLILVDIGLPDMAGFKLIEKIRATNERLAHTPIVVLTGYSEGKECDRCVKAGANQVLIKPVSQNVLEETLIRALQLKGVS